jgi:hypothetical protein
MTAKRRTRLRFRRVKAVAEKPIEQGVWLLWGEETPRECKKRDG